MMVFREAEPTERDQGRRGGAEWMGKDEEDRKRGDVKYHGRKKREKGRRKEGDMRGLLTEPGEIKK